MYLNENKVSQSLSLTHGRSPFPPHNKFRSLFTHPERKRNDGYKLAQLTSLLILKHPGSFV